MPSPFPGMDPYIEDSALWGDFHGAFLLAIRADLNRRLPDHYIARWDRYVWIDAADAEQIRPLGRPDVFVSDTLNRPPNASETSVLDAPATVMLPALEAEGKPFLKIIDVRGHRVVTIVELLSPANKTGRDREAYLAKRQEYFRTGVNVVEMDFLRTGQRPPVEETLAPADYYIIISRAIDYPKAGVWPLTVRDPLPTIPVPLDPQIESVELALRPCLDRVYEEARFDVEIDYQQPANLPLSQSDAKWFQELLAQNNH